MNLYIALRAFIGGPYSFILSEDGKENVMGVLDGMIMGGDAAAFTYRRIADLNPYAGVYNMLSMSILP